MKIDVGDVRLFVDVDGAEYVPDGPQMVRRPTVVVLHGGPGMDHSTFKTELASLREIAQVVYLDHRGNGRSDTGSRDTWTLDQWGDDVRAVCDALGIERPIVMGQSFGGMVAMAYAARHPGHAAGLIFSSTSARKNEERNLAVFERLGGPSVREIVRAFYAEPGDETLGPFMTEAMPLYNQRPGDPDGSARTIYRLEVLYDFFRGEYQTFNLLPGLARVECPTLVLGGEDDPTTPIEDQAEIAAALPEALVEFHRFAGCGHGAYRDQPETALPIMRDFILRCSDSSNPAPR